MPIFAIELLDDIPGRIKIFKLQKDGIFFFDEFQERIKKDGNFQKELITIQSILKQYANIQSLPSTKFKQLKGCKDTNTEYEVKTKNLRVYLFKVEKTGSIIVIGGKKNSQPKDISEFRKLKKACLEQVIK